MTPPTYSPWGEIQWCQELYPGAFEVSTPSHGGVMIRQDLATRLLSRPAIACGFFDYGYLCFEEDCDAPVALRELMDKGCYQPPINQYYKPGEYSRVINNSLKTYHPEYWAFREGVRRAKESQRGDHQR